MGKDSEHRALQQEALTFWGSGALPEARAKYEAAIAICPASHWLLGDYLGGYACVLDELGLSAEARTQYDRAVAHAEAGSDSDVAPRVAIARYLLGLHCIRQGEFLAALNAVIPALPLRVTSEALLRSVEAQALAGLERWQDARDAANAALALASSEKQRVKLRQVLANLLDDDVPA